MKILMTLAMLPLISFANLPEDFFGRVNGHEITSYEPCVYRDTSGGWYDHCFFDLDGENDFGEEVSAPAKQCAKEGNQRLYSWLNEKGSAPEAALTILERVFGAKYIYIIVTDTYQSSISNRTEATLWTWDNQGGSNGKGRFFKFNIGISNSGECHIPSEAQFVQTIKDWVGADLYLEELSRL